MTPVESSLVELFAKDPREPGWLAEARLEALARFRARGLPTSRDEDWRFTSLASLAPVVLERTRPADAEAGAARLGALLARAPGGGPRLVFVDGRLRRELSVIEGLPAGAIVSSLAQALLEAPALVKPHLGRLARPEEHAFVAANAALMADGGFVHLPAGATLDAPVVLVFLASGARPALASPRTLVVAGEGARATVAEVFLGEDGVYLTNAVTELVLGEGADVEHVRLQDESPRAFHVGVVAAEQQAKATLAAHALSLGGRLSRSELRTRLVGEQASVAANGLYMADGERLVDNFSWVEHAVPRCSTTETYKGVLDGHARGVFSGRIRVMPGAQKTVARQMNSNLLLSDDAIVDTKPQLEIFADDVKCGHGGTVGQLDEAALFYLRSRGLPAAEARGLLIYAFVAEMVDLVRAAPLRAAAKGLVQARLPAGARLLEAA
ncbi:MULTISPECIES: Fe-S cluster assembly protein SufD [unclassified Anaeromyxobacter]|uniref:Fe-S cluster assembly protein SufD n=1 Tax=unclassified Anaeromyxobacter TaxID=2620896 RepID=UPI001F55F7E9|nr:MULTISPECIES: Fe-S cluster assembly protein SufD [unclassified Anaeromyxobacter]